MKVAIYAGIFVKDQDGATKTLYELIESMLKKNIEVGVWTFSLTPMNKKGVSLFKLPSIPLPLYPEYKIAFPSIKLRAEMKSFKPDIIHVTVPDMVGIYLVKYAAKRGIPLVTSYHTDFPSYLKYYKLSFLRESVWKFFRWFYNKGKSVFVSTEEMAGRLKEKGIKNIKIWSRGIHREHYNPEFRSDALRSKWGAQNEKVILYSGRFVWYKDLDTYMEVYRLFKEKGPENVVFVMLGNGPIEEELKKRMPDAIFPGYLIGKELSTAYASSDILLFPSTTETFGNVIQEALASGLPAVVSDIGGCKEIVYKSDGGLVAKAKDANSFYECCKQLVLDEDLYVKKRRNGLKYAKSKSWKEINGRVIQEYITLTSNQAKM
ncbi:MAG: glycosyltransferase family 4 protein [Candidatus Aminicenantia bacterium]